MKYLPYAGEAVKLLFALRSNNINSRKLQAGVRPVLQDTYERFSPITGDFNALSTAGSNAAETQRRASLPFTSDASLQLAAQYDANRQAITTRLQGSRLYDQAIRQSQKEALARTEDNMARRTAVANNNRQAIQTARWTKAQIDAARRNNNTQSILNYMNDNLTRLRTSIDTKNQQGKAFQYNLAEQQIDNRYADEIADWRAKLAQMRAEGKSIVGTPEYNRYLGFMQRIQQWRANQKLMAYANIYGYNYRDYGTTPSIAAIQAGWGADV